MIRHEIKLDIFLQHWNNVVERHAILMLNVLTLNVTVNMATLVMVTTTVLVGVDCG